MPFISLSFSFSKPIWLPRWEYTKSGREGSKNPSEKRLCLRPGGSRRKFTQQFWVSRVCSPLLYFFFCLTDHVHDFFPPPQTTKPILTFLKSSCAKILSKQFCMEEADPRQETRETQTLYVPFLQEQIREDWLD